MVSVRHRYGSTLALCEFFARYALQGQEEIVLIAGEGETVFHRNRAFVDHVPNDGVEVLHAVQLAVTHRIEQRLALSLARFNIFPRAWTGTGG